MPVVPYYRGSPAHVWTTAMSGHGPALATAANSSAVTSPAGEASPADLRPAPTAQRRTREEASAAALAAIASAWEAWASLWFTPHRQP